MKNCVFLLFTFIVYQSFAQNTVTGRIVDKTNNKPVASAIVFLSNTHVESTTNNNGEFTLRNVPTGEYSLLVSFVGYEDYKIPVTVQRNMQIPDIQLTVKDNVLNDVVVKDKYKPGPYYYTFLRDFFGNSLFARQCRITNPWVIHFYDTDTAGTFSARSNGLIAIENNALGYKIKFLLSFFIRDGLKNRTYYNGQSYFEEMKGTPAQEREWQKNRLECYQGSVMQLLRSIIADDVKQNGFKIKKVYRKENPYFNRNGLETDPEDIGSGIDPFGNSDNTRYNDKVTGTNLTGKDILRGTNQPGFFAMSANNGYLIEHLGNTVSDSSKTITGVHWMWNSDVALITFDKPYAVFDHNGIVVTPGNITYSGFFTENSNVATLLPFDYKPVNYKSM